MSAKGLPSYPVDIGAQVYRIYRVRDRAGNSLPPWVFSSRDTASAPGRFDLDHPRGTCYTSDKPIGAWVEVFRNLAVVPRAEVDKRRLAHITRVGSPLRLADLCSPRTPPFAVTLDDLFAGDDYTKPQQLAREADSADFDGLHGLLRHDHTATARNIALFGNTGKPKKVRGWQTHSEPVAANDDLLSDVAERGIVIDPLPHNSRVTAPPP